jgi:hypothetical protein
VACVIHKQQILGELSCFVNGVGNGPRIIVPDNYFAVGYRKSPQVRVGQQLTKTEHVVPHCGKWIEFRILRHPYEDDMRFFWIRQTYRH